jgi:2-hydroxy-3-oxopropionate reductase
MSKPTIAFLGIGLMGFPMARNLLTAGFAVTAWNRTKSKAEALESFGGKVAESAQEAVTGADFVITMLSDGPSVSQLMFDERVASHMGAGTTLIDMSSIKPSEARAHFAMLEAMKINALDAPVSGGTKGADLASLAIMAGGEEAAFNAAKSVLSAMGRPTHVGPAGCGQIAKLANQGIVAITIGAVAEAILLAQKAGLSKGALRAALAGGFADSVILQQHGARMEDENFVPGGRSVFQLKDLNNLLDAANDLNATLPLAELQRDRFEHLVGELNGGDLDHAALFLELKARQ